MMLAVFCWFGIFFRLLVELFFASGRAEIIRLPIVFGFVGGCLGVDVHAAYGIFYHREVLFWAIRIT